MAHRNNNAFILTGAMGSGKSTILKILREKKILCVSEPAREILAEQRCIEGTGLPEKNPELFTHLLLSRSIHQFKSHEKSESSIIFDRGIPDNIGYAELFRLETLPFVKAAQHYRYQKEVFFLPAWEAIYENDEERKMSFLEAKKFGDNLIKTYEALDYTITMVPLDTPLARAEFIIERISKNLA